MRIGLIVGNAIRDLAGHTLLASELARRGATCFLTPARAIREALDLDLDFVLLENLRRTRHQFAAELIEKDVKVGVLDAEGGVLASWEWYGDALIEDAKVRNAVSCFCSWGPLLATEAAERGWYKSEQIHVTGAPRFDFYSEPWSDGVLPGAPDPNRWGRNASGGKPLVLINGRYAIANPASSTSQEKSTQVTGLRNYSQESAAKILDAQRQGMSTLVALVNSLAKHYPALDFVYRPHPFERLETYQALLELGRENLHLERSGDVSGWLKVCDVVIARSCTTAIEVGMQDKVALSPLWVATPAEIESAESVSVGCKDESELRCWLDKLANGEKLERPVDVKERHGQVVKDWFTSVDGQSHIRVADAICAQMDEKSVKAKTAPSALIKAKRRLFPSKGQSRKNRGDTVKYFSRQEVQQITNALGTDEFCIVDILPRGAEYSVRISPL